MAQDTKVPAQTTSAQAGGRTLRGWRPFETIQREIDRVFDDFSHFPYMPSPSIFQSETTPAVNVVEKPNEFQITAELPGMDEKDIEVHCASGALTIRGEKKEEKEEKRQGYYLSERRFGSFQRSFRLPEEVDADKIGAVFKKGVLTLTLPKRTEAQKNQKKIEIKAG